MASLGDCMDEDGVVFGRPISPPRSGLSDSMDRTPAREENDKPEEVSQEALQPETEQNNGSESGLDGSKGHTPEREEGENDEHEEEVSQEPLQPETEQNNGSESGLDGSKGHTPEREEGENDEHEEEVSQEPLQPETEENNGSESGLGGSKDHTPEREEGENDEHKEVSRKPSSPRRRGTMEVTELGVVRDAGITSEEENSLFYVPPQTIEGESFKKGVCPTEALEEDLLLLKSAIIGFFNGSQPSLSVVKHSLEKQWKGRVPEEVPQEPLQPEREERGIDEAEEVSQEPLQLEREEREIDEAEKVSQELLQSKREGEIDEPKEVSQELQPKREEEGEIDEPEEVSKEPLQPETERNYGSDRNQKVFEMPKITLEEENSLFYVPLQTVEGESIKKKSLPNRSFGERSASS
ncbi:hypothetical protein NE237_003677 [Protea cynaroides]|uniref:Uncharacterized protein n=1 Tax=Protea cynaroides TaxID=273540 RepID=A0A9Q0KH67_9MAGN|nr:hypothetical protein NE237_003677 [Protea cynaroides]